MTLEFSDSKCYSLLLKHISVAGCVLFTLLAKHVCLADAFNSTTQHDIEKRTNSLLERNKREERKIIFL